MVTCNLGLWDIAVCLLHNNADVHLRDNSGNGCLEAAICKKQKDITKLLITYGADIYPTNTGSTHPVHRYIQLGRTNKSALSSHTWNIAEFERFYITERNWMRRRNFCFFVHAAKTDTNLDNEAQRHTYGYLAIIANIQELCALIASFI